jgi:hypothetical protein
VCESAFTRWLTHNKTTKSIRRSFIPSCIGLDHDAEDRGDATARGLLMELLSFPFIGFMMIFSDVFPILARFSRMTQKSAAGSELIEHNFNDAVKIFLSTSAHPMHTTTAHDFYCLNLRHHHLTGQKMRRLQTDVHFTTGSPSNYKWGNVWGWTENTPLTLPHL